MKLTHTVEGDTETLIIEYKPSWFRSLFRLPLWERYRSPQFGIFWYKINEDGSAKPLSLFWGENQQIRSLARVAADRQKMSSVQK